MNIKSLSLLTFIFVLYGCAGGEEDISQPQPSLQLDLNIQVIGATSENPYGDGSGTIQCSATTNREASFRYTIDNTDVFETEDGRLNYSFATPGTQNHTIKVSAVEPNGNSVDVTQEIEVLFELSQDLIWSDEFTANGPADLSKWTYEIVPPNNGSWWNEEVQHYTSREKNSYAANGTFNIVAFKEPYNAYGSTKGYTSARLKTQQKFSFNYGRVEIRAKLPNSAGTWPAVWMLGSNVDQVGWPNCGEIDIIEQFSDKTQNISTAHWRAVNGEPADYGLGVTSSNLTSSFNIYEFDWTPNSIAASLNGQEYYRMNLLESMPFNNDFFLIMNLAMGGDRGAGPIDVNFTQDQLEIDYIRVYKN